MNYDQHVTDERIRWALDIVQDEDSRKRDGPWYDNARVLSALERLLDNQQPPRNLSPKILPFVPESILQSVASGRIADLELWRPTSAERNRLFVVAVVYLLWNNESLLARLKRCENCHRFKLADRASDGVAYCDDRCRKAKKRSTDPESRRYREPPVPFRRFGNESS